MKDKIKNIAEKLEHQIRMHELDLNDRIKDIPQIILLLEQGFSELKEIVSFYKFKSEMDEIFFFKIIKPKFFSKLIYYRKVYNIEMMRPNGQDCVLKNYFINELNQLENFYNKNIDFYKYYRSGSTHLDKYFFLRGKQDIQMTMETFYFERDPNFSTICDFKELFNCNRILVKKDPETNQLFFIYGTNIGAVAINSIPKEPMFSIVSNSNGKIFVLLTEKCDVGKTSFPPSSIKINDYSNKKGKKLASNYHKTSFWDYENEKMNDYDNWSDPFGDERAFYDGWSREDVESGLADAYE